MAPNFKTHPSQFLRSGFTKAIDLAPSLQQAITVSSFSALLFFPLDSSAVDGIFDAGSQLTGTGLALTAISANGKIVAGYRTVSGVQEAFTWDSETGVTSNLALPTGMDTPYVQGLSADGTKAAGIAFLGSSQRAAMWTPSGAVSLGVLNGGSYSAAYGISGDGSTVVGWGSDGADAPYYRGVAFRWRQSTGMVSLGFLESSAAAYS